MQQSNVMLLFAGCDDDHTAPHNDQRRKYAEVEYGKYAKDGVYIAKGMYVAKGKYVEYAKDVLYVTKGEYGKYAKEDASVEEGHNEPLAKEGNDKPLAKDGDWLGTTMSPLPQGQLAVYVMQDNNKPLTTRASDRVRCGIRAAYAMQGNNELLTTIGDWATTFNNYEGIKALTIKLIMPIVIPYHCNEVPLRLQ
jgi:hypothetical protein